MDRPLNKAKIQLHSNLGGLAVTCKVLECDITSCPPLISVNFNTLPVESCKGDILDVEWEQPSEGGYKNLNLIFTTAGTETSNNYQSLDYEIADKFINLTNSAKSRNKEFNLTLTSVRNLLKSKKCYYTGVELTRGKHGNLSIDRVDNDKGYVKGNVVACDTTFNKLKDDLTVDQIKAMYKGLSKAGLV